MTAESLRATVDQQVFAQAVAVRYTAGRSSVVRRHKMPGDPVLPPVPHRPHVPRAAETFGQKRSEIFLVSRPRS